MENIIHLKNIKFNYPNSNLLTLDIPLFEVKKGELLFLFGPSGTGKTTLLEILSGVLTPKEGTVKILDTDLTQLNYSQKDRFRSLHVGYIFQNFNLIPYLNVIENITLPLLIQGKSSKEGHQYAEELCKELGIANCITKKTSELSVGQQQRVAAARALITHPELILADEPTSALDHEHRQKFLELFFKVCRKNQSSVVFVSHDHSLEKMFDRSLSLSELNLAKPFTTENWEISK